uniref:Uncoupling protein 2 n=1 Tax=Ornithorhynchus anatinus TaxID=9258 RepID=A0A6I8PE69_ORNAN
MLGPRDLSPRRWSQGMPPPQGDRPTYPRARGPGDGRAPSRRHSPHTRGARGCPPRAGAYLPGCSTAVWGELGRGGRPRPAPQLPAFQDAGEDEGFPGTRRPARPGGPRTVGPSFTAEAGAPPRPRGTGGLGDAEPDRLSAVSRFGQSSSRSTWAPPPGRPRPARPRHGWLQAHRRAPDGHGQVPVGRHRRLHRRPHHLPPGHGQGPAADAGVGSRLLAGCTTGALAVGLAQPTDVVKVRFQAQARAAGSRRYQGTVDAYKTIAREEGLRGLWKGTSPNVARNAIVNCAELVTYDLIKDALLRGGLMADDLPCHLTSAFGAGFCTTVIASPVDVVKTRYMNSASGQYGGAVHCALTMLRKEGPRAFYKGFMPSFLRLGSWNVVMFVTYEQLKRAITAARAASVAPC